MLQAEVQSLTTADRLRAATRIVVKIGSALLVDPATGKLRRQWLEGVADDVAAAKARGQDVVIVSSGAIALGRRQLGLPKGPLRLEESQAAAAVGQIRLTHAWQEVLAGHGLSTAQILLTLDDTENRRRYLNGRSTMATLLGLGAVPVINENDTVATSEIRYGDNDRLAARVAELASADCLILLSDIDGLYTANPNTDPDAKHLPLVNGITPEIEAMAGEPVSGVGSGGMITKVAAARIALSAGCSMVIGAGHVERPISALEKGARCTWFLAERSPRQARKMWIGGSISPKGRLIVDEGAARALAQGKSLLPAGVREVDGEFSRGDAVMVVGLDGRALGRGLVAYSSEDARAIAGHKSGEIETLLGYRGRDEMIHRDDLAIDG
ncbi:glutamate 5-kinase [Zavarzinia sp.]|uniref:glutamate 5-kinase n=1 Tax=Zavarzinia sp. TaxID=2027920 RepID=UPI00356A81F6